MAAQRVRTVLAITLAVLSVGCGGTVAGTPKAAAPASPTTTARPSTTTAPATQIPGAAGLSSSHLGNLSTIDPCTLTDQDSLPGLTVSGDSLLAFDLCTTTVDSWSGSRIELLVGPFGALPSQDSLAGKKVQLVRPLRIIKDEPEGRTCLRRLLFDDLVTLEIRAIHTGDRPVDPRLCMRADDTADVVHRTVMRRQFKHFDFAPNSLGRLDPCQVVPADAVATVPGLAGSQPVAVPSRHRCTWGPFANGGPGDLERLAVVVRAADSDTACRSAVSVARLVWSKIPPG